MSYIADGLHVNGPLSATSFTLPAGSVTDAGVAGGANIDPAKMRHRHKPLYSQAGTAAAETRAVFVATHSGVVVSFAAGHRTALTGDATTTFDLRKNGVSVLSAVVSFTSATAAYALLSGTVTTTAFVAGDVFEVVVAVAAGTGALGAGPFARPVFDEAGV